MGEIKQWSKEAAINGNEFKTKRSPVAYFWSKDFTSNLVFFIVKSKLILVWIEETDRKMDYSRSIFSTILLRLMLSLIKQWISIPFFWLIIKLESGASRISM